MKESSPLSSLRILVATEYLPPYVSGIANRCRNLTQGYKEAGAQVTVVSVKGTDCDMTGTSISNPFYSHQRSAFIKNALFSLSYA